MKTLVPVKNLVSSLERLQTERPKFDEVCEELFAFNYEDFDELFEFSKLEVDNDDYLRIPIYTGDCVAILMIWGKDVNTAIHDHQNYDIKIKVLKGILTESIYKENNNFIEFRGVISAVGGVKFPNNSNGIHSIINNTDDVSVSLHIYNTQQINLEGVRLFDTENRKIGYLNYLATSCKWNIPEECFSKIVKI